MSSYTLRGLGPRLAVGAMLGLLVIIALELLADGLLEALGRFEPSTLALVLGCSLLGYVVRYVKWECYLARLTIRLDRLESVLCFQAGMVMSISPGKVGEVLKSYLLKRSSQIPVATTAPIVLAERLTDLLALIILASFGVIAIGFGVEVLIAGLILVVAIMGVLLSERLSEMVLSALRRLPRGEGIARGGRDAIESSRKLLSPSTFTVTLVLSTIAWGLEGYGTYLVFQGLIPEAFVLGEAIFIFAFSTVAGALSMLPGGMLAAEGSMVALMNELSSLPVGLDVAAACTLIVRFATLWFGVILGAGALWLFYRVVLSSAPVLEEE